MSTPLIQGPEHFPVRASAREPLVDFIVAGLEDAGCRVLTRSSATQAPFLITYETPDGERAGVLAYAFLANRTVTNGRPADERSFQIKYGPNDGRLHELWQDELGLITTILLGIDPVGGFFIAADPVLHNPTRFFIRLEFKDRDADAVRAKGWHTWERTHRGRRDIEPEERAFDFEALVGGTRDRILDLIRFERTALRLPPGDRQLLAERFFDLRSPPTSALLGADEHPLLTELQLSSEQILELISQTRRLKMAVRGWVAEEHLRDRLAGTPGITHVERLADVEGGPDLVASWRSGRRLTIECKNAGRKPDRFGRAKIDFQRTRASRGDPCSRYYSPADFDIVAGCIHATTEKWEFLYHLTGDLRRRNDCPGTIDNRLILDASWTNSIEQIFEASYALA